MTRPTKSLAQALAELREDLAAVQRYEQEGQEDWLMDAEDDLRSSVQAVLAAIDSGDRIIDDPSANAPGAGGTTSKQAA